MKDFKILNNFFESQHRKWKLKTYTTLQDVCGKAEIHSDYGEWLKRRNSKSDPLPSPEKPKERPLRD